MSDKIKLVKWLRLLLKNENVKESDIELCGEGENGDGFLGDIVFFSLKLDNEIPKNCVLKCGKEGETYRQILPIKSAFENEIGMYTKIHPHFVIFQKNTKVGEVFDNFPKCYGTYIDEDTELILLENLRTQNYTMMPKKDTLPLGLVENILRTYGKFHAISFALKDQYFGKFAEFGEMLTPLWKIFYGNKTFTDIREFNIKEIQKILGEANVDANAIKKIESLLNIDEIFATRHCGEPNVVITHGDCWNNNIMFKFKDGDKKNLEHLKLIDWQLSQVASPAMDLSYFIFCCCSSKELDNLEDLLKIYHNSLSHHIELLGSDADKIFPFTELQKEWKKYGKFGLITFPNVIRLAYFDKEEFSDLKSVQEKDVIGNLSGAKINQQSFSDRVISIMTHPETQKLL